MKTISLFLINTFADFVYNFRVFKYPLKPFSESKRSGNTPSLSTSALRYLIDPRLYTSYGYTAFITGQNFDIFLCSLKNHIGLESK